MAEKKTFALRLSPELYEAIQRIADLEFRSVNGQIEFVLSDFVAKRTKSAKEQEDHKETGR